MTVGSGWSLQTKNIPGGQVFVLLPVQLCMWLQSVTRVHRVRSRLAADPAKAREDCFVLAMEDAARKNECLARWRAK